MRRKRILALLLAGAMLLLLLTSAGLLALRSQHECTGEDCTICALLVTAQQLLSRAACVPIAVALLAPPLCLIGAARAAELTVRLSRTPVSLKVKLSD